MGFLAIFLLFPVIEIAVFIVVGGWIGVWATIGLVIVMAVLGVGVIRRQGIATLARLQESVARNEDPSGPLAHGALVVIAGVLLLLPGFVTDALGLALLVPPIRRLLIGWGASRAAVRVTSFGSTAGFRSKPADVIDADYEVVAPLPGDEASSPSGRGRPSGWVRPPD